MSAPSYHDVVVYVDGQAHRIADNYAYELVCTRVGGWQLYFHTDINWNGVVDTQAKERFGRNATAQRRHDGKKSILVGGEFHGNDEFRIDVNGVLVCVGAAAEHDESASPEKGG